MNEKNGLKLDEVIESGLERLSGVDLGTDESEAIIDDLAKLYKLKFEGVKVDEELTDKDMNRDVIVQQVNEQPVSY